VAPCAGNKRLIIAEVEVWEVRRGHG
jgi:hypothetical protein